MKILRIKNEAKRRRHKAETGERQLWTAIKENALRVSPAVTRLTVYRRLQVQKERSKKKQKKEQSKKEEERQGR